MHLESTRDQCVNISDAQLSLQFAAFETIHTENGYKFSESALGALLDDAGFTIEQTWTDPLTWYTLTLAGLESQSIENRNRRVLQNTFAIRSEAAPSLLHEYGPSGSTDMTKPLLAPCSIHGRARSRRRSKPRGVQESSDPSRGGSRSSRRAGRARGR